MLDNGVARGRSPHSRNAPSSQGGYIHDYLGRAGRRTREQGVHKEEDAGHCGNWYHRCQ